MNINHDRGTKSEFFDIHILCIVSSVSARKLKCPSSAQLGSEPSQLGLARAGKFQLEPISSRLVPYLIHDSRNSLWQVKTKKEGHFGCMDGKQVGYWKHIFTVLGR